LKRKFKRTALEKINLVEHYKSIQKDQFKKYSFIRIKKILKGSLCFYFCFILIK